MMPFPSSRRFHFVHIGQVLSVGREGCIVLMIGELFVTHYPNVVEPFVGTLSPREMVMGRRFGIRSEKDPPLKVFRDLGSSDAEPSLGHVNKADNAVDGGTGFFAIGI